jgi:GH24 family phage-related lysozyme (muramidase)|tara:strand:- start:197 stop:718 length:522 start_codon:yes stop_codon:yes gene_type:complete
MLENISLQEQANRRAAAISQNNRIKAFGNYLLPFEGFDEVARRGAGEKYLTLGHGHYGPDVKEGQTISRKDAALLFQKDIVERIPQIQKLIPKFDSFPASAQTALFGEFYRGSLTGGKKGSPKTIRLINEGKFEEASKEFLRNNEYINRVKLNRRGIGPRMENVSSELMKMSK